MVPAPGRAADNACVEVTQALSSRPLPLLRVLRLANPVVRRLLASPFHRLLSERLLVLTYRGHRSGRSFSIPLRYAELADGRLVAAAVRPASKLWWRSFRSSRDAVITLRRADFAASATLAAGQARAEAAAAYEARYPRSARLLDDAALVVFTRTG